MNDSSTCPRCGQAFDGAEPACPACGRLRADAPCPRHPERAASGRCVVCGTPVCDACDDGGRTHFSCPEHREIPVVEGWAQVYSTSDDVEASLIRDNLQSEGVDAEILSQKDSSFALDLGDLSPVRVLVPAFDYQRAQALMDSHMDAAGEVRFACASCGEAYEEGAEVCASCGAALA
jgi:ribosomal protein L37E